MRVNFILKENIGMIVIIEFKRRIASICIFNIIVSKLSYRQEFCLIILFLIDKSTKISLYFDILFFNLAVCLWMKCSRGFLLNTKKIAQQRPEF